MLTSKARRRLALKTSAFALLGAGVFVGLPAITAWALPAATPVNYTCNANAVTFTMEMSTPAQATPSGPATINWQIRQPGTGGVTASASIAATATIVADATVSPSGSPIPSNVVITPSGAVTAATAIPEGSQLPIPTMPIVVTPTATGQVTVKGDAFSLKVNNTVVATCSPAAAGAGPAATLMVVTPGATGTGTGTGTPTSTGTGTPTPTATQTTSTPRPTKTHTEFVTATPTKKSSRTPKAGADTGGGGEIGPDGRMFMLVGSVLILGAGAGGLMMRRRTATKG